MGIASRRGALTLALCASTATGILFVWAFWAIVAGAADFGLVVRPLDTGDAGETQVQWVAPNGPAWSLGLQPGDIVLVPRDVSDPADTAGRRYDIAATAPWSVLRHDGAHNGLRTLAPASPPPVDAFDVAIFSLGMGLLALGAVILVKSADAVAGWTFWRMSLCVGAALAFAPAGSRGILWVLPLHFVALRLAAPAVAALAWVFPAHTNPASARRRGAPAVLWLPTYLLLALYPACWLWPAPLFSLLQVLDGAALLGYLVWAIVLLVMRWWHSHRTALERTQLRLITLGIVGGFTPFLLLTVLPLLIVGHVVLPFQVSILALVLLPLSVAVAIVQAELLGITDLVHRHPLRLTIGGALLVSLGGCAWIVSVFFAHTLNSSTAISAPIYVAITAMLSALLYCVLYRRATDRIERLLLRDTYNPAQAFLEMSVDLTAAASASALATGAVERLGLLLDLTFAVLVSPTDVCVFHHPRRASRVVTERIVLLEQATVEHAQDMLGTDKIDALETRTPAKTPCLFVPIQLPADAGALPDRVLCLGPKRSGDTFTAEDRTLLATLGRHIAMLLHNHALRAELDKRLRDQEHLVAERAVLTERLITVSARERRELAAVLHDDAIQLAGQVERLLGDAVAELGDAQDLANELANEAWRLSHEVTGHLRDVVSSLHPPPLDMAGLVPALQTLLRDAERQADVVCSFVYDPCLEANRLASQDEHLLYQLVREAVANALRHAAASTVNIKLGLSVSGSMRLVVRDDGRGFAPQPLSHWLVAGHLGLALLYERVQERGGWVQLATAPGAGTTVTIELPMNVAAREREREEKEGEAKEEGGARDYTYRGRG